MYAVIGLQGFQYKVQPDDRIEVPLLKAEVGDRITLDNVMLVADGDNVVIGKPTVAGAAVEVEVISHFRGPKIIVGKFKRRKNYRRRNGYRDDLTELRVRNIVVSSGPVTASEASGKEPAPEGGEENGA